MVSDSYSIVITANALKITKNKNDREIDTRKQMERGRGERRKEGERKEKRSHLLHFLHNGGKGLKKGRKVKEAVIR